MAQLITLQVLGVIYAVLTAAVFQVIIKWVVGGLRPHFLAACKPSADAVAADSTNGPTFTRNVCTGDDDKITDALKSFPSGHATAAFAGFVFLSLYLNAKLKLWSSYHPALWKLVLVFAPILGAILIAGLLTVDNYHHWYDVLAGALIGTAFALAAYRMVYASIWDFRYNHVPLVRNSGFPYELSTTEVAAMGVPPFTRRAEWGMIPPPVTARDQDVETVTSAGPVSATTATAPAEQMV